jgi:hypothetical protein
MAYPLNAQGGVITLGLWNGTDRSVATRFPSVTGSRLSAW